MPPGSLFCGTAPPKCLRPMGPGGADAAALVVLYQTNPITIKRISMMIIGVAFFILQFLIFVIQTVSHGPAAGACRSQMALRVSRCRNELPIHTAHFRELSSGPAAISSW